MSAELLGEGPADIEAVVVEWLQPLRRTANTRRPGDPLPMTVVECIAGVESVEESRADPVVSVHTLVRKSLGEDNASTESQNTHRRMLLLARYLEDFNIDYLKVFQYPRREAYGDDQIIRYVGRYQFGQSYE
jgi:hypothetical protein